MIKILSTMAVMGAMRQIVPLWNEPVEVTYAPTMALVERLRSGERADLVFLTAAGIAQMEEAGVVRAGSAADVARSYVGVAVRAGALKPDIGTVPAFRAALLAARSVAWSKIGASGLFFAGLIQRLGIEAEMLAKGLVVPGFTAEKAASGEAELAVQQISELLVVPGIEVVGPLPPEIQTVATFSGGLTPDAAAGAEKLLRFMVSDEAVPLLRQSGLEPAKRG